jgi:hypothetical protein
LLAMRYCTTFALERRRTAAWESMRVLSSFRGDPARDHFEAARLRANSGTLPGDERILMACGVMALTGRRKERPLEFAPILAIKGIVEPLPWWAFDMHTLEGKRTISDLEKRGNDRQRVTSLWWYWESALVNNELGNLSREERILRGFGDDTRHEWDLLRNEVRDAVITTNFF